MFYFFRYYSGEKQAPVLTIFIGGNHEASNFLQEHPYGGWVAPNIYYLGYAGVVNIGGLRIGGMSGIYKGHDYLKGHFEKSPYNGETIRSVYHVRNLEVFRLKQLSGDIDIMMSHDWPRGIYHHGNKEDLIRRKNHFRDEIMKNTLGSRPAEDLIHKLKPSYWFSGHLHVKFAAILKHENEGKQTKFLALDKCLPRREFLQVIKIENQISDLSLKYDAEWLTVLRLTNHLLSTTSKPNYMPGPNGSERYDFTPTKAEIEETMKLMNGDLTIPLNFSKTAPAFKGNSLPQMSGVIMPAPVMNGQTIKLCDQLGIDDPMALLLGMKRKNSSSPRNSYGDLPMNSSELEITLDSSATTSLSYDLTLDKDSSDEDICSSDIIMEMNLADVSPITTCTSKRILGSDNENNCSPDSKSVGRKLVLSTPRSSASSEDDGKTSPSLPIPLRMNSTSTNCEEEQGDSPNRSSLKRSSDDESSFNQSCSEKESPKSQSNSFKRLKRRNQAIYSSTDDDV